MEDLIFLALVAFAVLISAVIVWLWRSYSESVNSKKTDHYTQGDVAFDNTSGRKDGSSYYNDYGNAYNTGVGASSSSSSSRSVLLRQRPSPYYHHNAGTGLPAWQQQPQQQHQQLVAQGPMQGDVSYYQPVILPRPGIDPPPLAPPAGIVAAGPSAAAGAAVTAVVGHVHQRVTTPARSKGERQMRPKEEGQLSPAVPSPPLQDAQKAQPVKSDDNEEEASNSGGGGGLRATRPLVALDHLFYRGSGPARINDSCAPTVIAGGVSADAKGAGAGALLTASTSSEETSGESGAGRKSSGGDKVLLNNQVGVAGTLKSRSKDAASSVSHSIDMSDVHLDRLIGGGAFGQVYRGTWHGTTVAVKILTSLSVAAVPLQAAGASPDGRRDNRDGAVAGAVGGGGEPVGVPEAVLRAFEDEVDVFARLRHPNICLFLGACLAPPTRAIVTELVARGSLWEVLRTPGLFEVIIRYVYSMYSVQLQK